MCHKISDVARGRGGFQVGDEHDVDLSIAECLECLESLPAARRSVQGPKLLLDALF